MSQIERLSASQVADLATIRDEWLRIGLSVAPTDRSAAESGVRLAYERAGLAPPRIMIWLRSPFEGAIGAAYLDAMAKAAPGAQGWAQVRDQVRDQVWAQVRAQVGAQVGAQVWAQVRAQVRAQVGAQVWDQVRAQVWDQVWDQVGDQVGSACYGLHDAEWLAFYDYMSRAVGFDTSKLDGIMSAARSAGWWWPFRGAAILTERPRSLHRDDRGRLHSENAAAIEYGDEWGVYAWHGVRVPSDVILAPAGLTVARIDGETNAEIRRVMTERYGLARYVRDSGASVLHSDVDGLGHPRRLLRKDVADDEPIVLVEVTNSTPELDGSRRIYHLPVHHELRPFRKLANGEQWLGEPQDLTCHNAVASTWGLTGEDYSPSVET